MATSARRCDWVAAVIPAALLALLVGCAADMESSGLGVDASAASSGNAATGKGGSSDDSRVGGGTPAPDTPGGHAGGATGGDTGENPGDDKPEDPSSDDPSKEPPGPVVPWKTLQLSKFAGALSLPAESPVFMFKPQADKLRVLTCDGAGKELAGDGPSVTEMPAAESGTLPVTIATTCVLQVQSQAFWALETLNGEHRIVRIQARSEGSNSLDQWRTPVQFPGQPAIFPRPLAVTESSLVFFLEGKLLFFKWVAGSSDSQSSPRLTLLRLNWNSSAWGAPLSAGSDGGSFWAVTKTQFVIFSPKAAQEPAQQVQFVARARTLAASPFTAQSWASQEVRAAAFSVSVPAGAADPLVLGRSAVLLADGLYLTPAAP